MKLGALFLTLVSIAWLALSCVDSKQPLDPRNAVSVNRATAPGLDLACADKPGNHLARRPNAPVGLLCALTLPAGEKPIQNITKTWVDGGRLYLTEVGNGKVYVFDPISHGYVGAVSGFVGSTGNAATSGPNSIVLSGDGHAWVSDGVSAVKVVDVNTLSIIASIGTAIAACDNGTVHRCQRTNEITFDPEHHIIFVQNPSPLGVTSGTAIDTYGTFISSDAPYTVLGTIAFPNRQGQEAPLYDPDQHRILTAVSGRQVVAGGVVTALYPQFVAVIDPTVRPFVVENHFDIDCTALGITVAVTAANPTGRTFGINDPSLAPGGKMVIPGCGRAILMDARTGAQTVAPVGGGNETWYNPGDGNFYVTGADFSVTPQGPNSLGVIDAQSGTVVKYITALGLTNPAAAAENNLIFGSVPGNANATACTQFGAAIQTSGCVLVFAHVPGAD